MDQGFRDAKSCFEAIEGAVHSDGLQQAAAMAQLQEALLAIQRQWEADARAAANSPPPDSSMPPGVRRAIEVAEAKAGPSVVGSDAGDGASLLESGPRVAWAEVDPGGVLPVPGGGVEEHAPAESKGSGGPAGNRGGAKGLDDDDAPAEAKGLSLGRGSGGGSSGGGGGGGGCGGGAGGDMLAVGALVELAGLESRPDLNGRVGVVTAVPPSGAAGGGRLTVVLREVGVPAGKGGKDEAWSGEEFLFKQRNLRALEGEGGGVGGDRGAVVERVAAATAAAKARAVKLRRAEGGARAGQVGTPAPPVVMFCQPVALDSLIEQVLSLAEYTTFSHVMRMKVS